MGAISISNPTGNSYTVSSTQVVGNTVPAGTDPPRAQGDTVNVQPPGDTNPTLNGSAANVTGGTRPTSGGVTYMDPTPPPPGIQATGVVALTDPPTGKVDVECHGQVGTAVGVGPAKVSGQVRDDGVVVGGVSGNVGPVVVGGQTGSNGDTRGFVGPGVSGGVGPGTVDARVGGIAGVDKDGPYVGLQGTVGATMGAGGGETCTLKVHDDPSAPVSSPPHGPNGTIESPITAPGPAEQ